MLGRWEDSELGRWERWEGSKLERYERWEDNEVVRLVWLQGWRSWRALP